MIHPPLREWGIYHTSSKMQLLLHQIASHTSIGLKLEDPSLKIFGSAGQDHSWKRAENVILAASLIFGGKRIIDEIGAEIQTNA